MSLPIPLSVTLQTGRRTMRITNQVMDLSFRTTIPGGFASASVSLHRPLQIQPDEIAYYGSMLVHDTRNGRVAWEGRLNDPGRSAGGDGTVWDLAAIGPSGHASDRRLPLIYVDASQERWRRHSSSLKAARTDATSDDDDTAKLVMSFNEGSTVATGETATMIYRALRESGQELARVRAQVTNGGTSSLWENRLLTQNGSASVRHNLTWSTTPAFVFAERGGTPSIPAGDDIALYRLQRVGAGGTASAASWGEFASVIVRAILMDKSGNDITSGYTTNTVFAHEIVADLLGRLLTEYDGADATIATNTFAIDQLAYPDGVTPAEVLDDLMAIEAAHYWAAWESGGNGNRFEWAAYPTTVRYEADVTDGYKSTGSAEGLYSRVNVRWRSPQGNIRIRQGSQTVPELADAGITREETIDLGDNIASSSIGDRVRDEFLADHMAPRNEGSLTIARPILDRQAGMAVMPWEIRPGNLIRVRGIQPRVDSINPAGRDGVTVFRIVSTAFSASDASVSLELDSYSHSTARAIADLQRRRRRRR